MEDNGVSDEKLLIAKDVRKYVDKYVSKDKELYRGTSREVDSK